MSGDRFAFAPGVRLGVDGPAWARRHFAAEYGPVRVEDDDAPDVRLVVAPAGAAEPLVPVERYRTLSWRTRVLDDEHGRTVRLGVAGRPRWFALSLLQGWLVEPVLSLAAGRAGHVLLPAAAVDVGGRAVLLVGGSGAGKTSMCARVLAAGGRVLGDDQVLLSPDGCRRFPRRLRLYDDLRHTAPEAHAQLSPSNRVQLLTRTAVRRVSAGRVTPPLPIALEALGTAADGPLPVSEVVVLRRSDVHEASLTRTTIAEVVAELGGLLAAQRSHLSVLLELRQDLREVPHLEAATVVRSLGPRPGQDSGLAPALTVLTFPSGWPAREAVRRNSETLGLV